MFAPYDILIPVIKGKIHQIKESESVEEDVIINFFNRLRTITQQIMTGILKSSDTEKGPYFDSFPSVFWNCLFC